MDQDGPNRPPVNTHIDPVLLQPRAAPVDTFVAPGPNGLQEFAQGLSKIDAPLRQFIDGRAKKQAEDDELRGRAAFYEENSPDIAEAVSTGRLPAHWSPAFVRGFKNAQGGVAGTNLLGQFNADFDAWDGKNSDDPDAYENFVAGWLKDHVQTQDPEVLRGLLPKINQLQAVGDARYTQYRHEHVYKGSLNAHVAAANQDIDEANREGLSTEEGTNYPVVFKAITQRRADFVAHGGNPDDFDKSMVDAMSAKILATRDPGLLAWFDQKVPGKDYTYGDSPYGQKVKLDTENNLEVIARRSVAEDAAKQKAANEKAKDDAHRQAVEILSKDPSAAMPDGLLKAGEQADPTFKVRVEEWRKSLGAGFSDPEKIKHVYDNILNGGGFKAVYDAASQGVFGRPEDLTAAYTFAKSFEDNGDRIKQVTTSAGFETITRAIDVRTKGHTDIGNPIDGVSNEGFEALYDFKRLAMDWVVRHPDATAVETDEAVSKIGKQVIDRIKLPEGLMDSGTYERRGGLGFDNPFTAGTATIPGSEPDTEPQPQTPALEAPTPEPRSEAAPTQPSDRATALGREAGSLVPSPEVEDLLNGLTPEQRQSVEAQAKRQGMSVQDFAQKVLLAPKATVQKMAFEPSSKPAITPELAGQFLDEALAGGNVGGSADSPTSLLGLIRKHEAAGNYNAVYGNAHNKVDLGQFSVNQLLAMQVAARHSGAASTAIGGYQIIYRTLRGLKKTMGLTGAEKFTPALQDRMAMALLEGRGLRQFEAGKLSKRQFALRLSQEWAALPDPSTGQSYYSGDGLNASSVSPREVYAALGFRSAGGAVQQASYQQAAMTSTTPTPEVYANIPDTDGGGQGGQREKFLEWNPDPIGNNEANIAQLQPNLASVIKTAQKNSPVQFVVGSGKRSAADQEKAVKWGWSKTVDSDHLDGSAVDLWPIIDGKVAFDPKAQKQIINAMKQAAKQLGVSLDVGGEWKRFKDMPHFALKGTSA